MKENDIYRWSYTEAYIKKHQDSVNAGTLYWCVSRFGVFDGANLVDTYWHGSDNRRFSIEEISAILEVRYLGNFDELEKTNTPEYYKETDIVNLNHPNSSRGNIYKCVGAKKDLGVMINLAHHKIDESESEIRYHKNKVANLKQRIEELKESNDLEREYV